MSFFEKYFPQFIRNCQKKVKFNSKLMKKCHFFFIFISILLYCELGCKLRASVSWQKTLASLRVGEFESGSKPEAIPTFQKNNFEVKRGHRQSGLCRPPRSPHPRPPPCPEGEARRLREGILMSWEEQEAAAGARRPRPRLSAECRWGRRTAEGRRRRGRRRGRLARAGRRLQALERRQSGGDSRPARRRGSRGRRGPDRRG